MDSELDSLLERSRRGDPRAWGSLIECLQAHVYTVPRALGLSEEDAGDVFMATFEMLHRNLDRVGTGRTLPTWLATVATRESYQIIRLRSRAGEVPLDKLMLAKDWDMEAAAVRADDAFRVQIALTKLAKRCRSLLEALYEDKASYAEVSDRLGIPHGTIGPTRARCLERLRLVLEKRGFFG